MPVLIVLLFGVYEFSWFFYQQHLVSMGLRDAARYLARAWVPCDPGIASWLSEEVQARNLATTGYASGGPPRIKGWTVAAVSITCTPVANQAEADGLRHYRGGPAIFLVTASNSVC